MIQLKKNVKMKFIAEFCQNHLGDRKILEKQIIVAKENGATFGKIQGLYSSELVRREEFEASTDKNVNRNQITRPYSDEYSRLKKLNYPTFGSLEKRNKWTTEVNKIIFRECKVNKFKYIDIIKILKKNKIDSQKNRFDDAHFTSKKFIECLYCEINKRI